MVIANYQPFVNSQRRTQNIFQELTFYKEMLYSLQMSYRIHQDEGTLTSLRLVQKLHDTTLVMARQQHQKTTQIVVRNDLEFERALQYILS